jgi:hypothetical protein
MEQFSQMFSKFWQLAHIPLLTVPTYFEMSEMNTHYTLLLKQLAAFLYSRAE